MKLDIDSIINTIIVLVAVIGGLYTYNKQKIEKLKIAHPQLAKVLVSMGELALKASYYQATIEGKAGIDKLNDATDEVYAQIKRLYPNIPINRNTVRNYVQHMYDAEVKGAPTDNAVLPKADTSANKTA